ncbi:MAG TPA: hypothetical protein VFL36_08250 [Myxococcales bacterium]|nr:hypothetical protein [Myxococcales bacterium]
MNHAALEDLEALAAGELPDPQAVETEDHAAHCEECGRELSWVRAERALFARRPSPPTAHLWAGIEGRLRHPRRLPHWASRMRVALVAAVAAAAVLLFAVRPHPVQPVATQTVKTAQRARPAVDPKTLAALDRAEADYRDAARILEAEYERVRPQLDPALAQRWDETLTRARAQLGESRSVASNDVNARMRVLDGYAGYLRSLRNLVQQSEEAIP